MNDGGSYYEEPIVKEPIASTEWYALRKAEVCPVEHQDGSVRFRVTVWDEGREPFVTKWFNDPRPAIDLMEKIKNENQQHHDLRIKEVE